MSFSLLENLRIDVGCQDARRADFFPRLPELRDAGINLTVPRSAGGRVSMKRRIPFRGGLPDVDENSGLNRFHLYSRFEVLTKPVMDCSNLND